MTPAVPALLTFLTVFLALSALHSLALDLWLRDRDRFGARVDEEFGHRPRGRRPALLRAPAALPAGGAAEDEPGPDFRRRAEAFLEQSGLNVSCRGLLLASAACAVGLGLVLGAAGWLLDADPLPLLLAAPLGAGAPAAYVAARRRQRLDCLLSQLPDAFDTLARSLRAGQSLAQGFQAAADELAPPVADELAYCREQQNLGLPAEIALRELAGRVGLLEVRLFVLALLVQQQFGGNLAELLDKLSAVVRDRLHARGRLHALTAEGRMQAVILMALPPVLFVGLLLFKRDYVQALLRHPGLLVAVVVGQVVGALWIRSITRLKT